jgi:hypothetical protein
VQLLYRLEAALTEIVPIGLVPEGVRLDVHLEGAVAEGALEGARVTGIDYLLLRADGVGVIDAYEAFTAGDGRAISAHARGYIVPPPGVEMPPPDVLLDPDFRWPDAPLPMHGFILYRTGAAGWEELNSTAAPFEGSVNVGTGELIVIAHASLRSPLAL